MYKALYLSPMIPSFNIPGTVKFFTDVLNFNIGRDDKTYVILYKDHLTIHIMNAGDTSQMEFYLEVDNVDEVWSMIGDQVNNLEVRAPFDREYGMREIHIVVPYTGTLMFIGSQMKKP
jgi:hypothetical protein